MQTGAITPYIDVAQLVLYAFWIFFAGLIVYLLRENKREGYPLESDRSERAPRVKIQGFPAMPPPKTFLLRDGRRQTVPRPEAKPEVRGAPSGPWPGAPLVPSGDPMLAEIGPGTYSQRTDIPDTTWEGEPRLVPLRDKPDFSVTAGDPDPVGLPVICADGKSGGTIVDCWVDQAEIIFRFLEVKLPDNGGHVLLPMNFCRVTRREVRVASVMSSQLNSVPRQRQADVITLLEEDKVMAYYGGGTLYASPSRAEPLL